MMETKPWGTEWADALSMSNPEIDAEHKHFIDLVNMLNQEIASQQRDKDNILRIMKLILDDALAHFAHEERLFKEKTYPKAVEHAQIHKELIKGIKQGLEDIRNTDHISRWVEVGLAIESALVTHLVEEDTKYIDYLRTE
ncbi:MAG: chemotaxis protein [Zetaproteobacteria bacterium CG12_big_fil_rev_8_21_14_0_65_55_1124]|nr:MAG: chemotaxis protein [Zetaproteobacteria bacterium CG08_land_8_20_14_0_20_55_17]PIW42195.1 MAG: chemotaxis protein [Zetaproteobacteria bacterium CG12_big_fil_rev_8_21_14_0_65_55_1124]PIY54325.1 MAG: chemotaxis protein [Zetaproteobacteria bacterium CG_4_10_14_0_8_um_filter_55_43]PIZ38868.1 MAG: chemotaxis protein [Zetaproteobacteria bacterium CG_4_10_14_0_2_um_filter_55_20]PJB82818.1 MAG: chemotaxis protein [Zetaproteobacteria bacterium CG_4_9_14_0_8_um_filter_55_31]